MTTLRRAWLTDRLQRLASEILDVHSVMQGEPGQHAEGLMAWVAATADKFAEASAVVADGREEDFVP